jgi:hypothetical protein
MTDSVVSSADVVDAVSHPAGASLIKDSYDLRLTNEDLAPLRDQHWTSYNIFAFWMSDVHSVGGYVTAGSLFALGLTSWQVLISLLVGIVIVNFFCNLVAKPSQMAGVPYPVICRAPFGVRGANIPAIIRGSIAVAWYGIQTYLASSALDIVVVRLWSGLAPYADVTQHGFLGLSALGWVTYAVLWVLQAAVFWMGMESIRRFIDFCGPAVYVVMFLLCGYLLVKSNWHVSFNLSSKHLTGWSVVTTMLSAIALVVSYFSGPMLNFGDFSRYGKSFEAVKRGNFLGLPVNFLVFSLLTVVTAAATLPVFGELITDPVTTVSRSTAPSPSCSARSPSPRPRSGSTSSPTSSPRLRLLERQPAADQLADGRHDRRRRIRHPHALELVRQRPGDPLHAGRARGPDRPAVRRPDRRLLQAAQAARGGGRPVHHVAERAVLVQRRVQPGRGLVGGDRRRGLDRLGGAAETARLGPVDQRLQLVHRCGIGFGVYYLLAGREARPPRPRSMPTRRRPEPPPGSVVIDPMRIRVINPNTTASMTATIEKCARAVAGPGTLIEAVTSPMGPARSRVTTTRR